VYALGFLLLIIMSSHPSMRNNTCFTLTLTLTFWHFVARFFTRSFSFNFQIYLTIRGNIKFFI
jgi:hypothetical protein